ncbi:MAG: ABC transporter ATP-binding protein [Bacteroidales bacterium]|nr:ABC transporter ATP-binding protein [Bacteroidales bacterium]
MSDVAIKIENVGKQYRLGLVTTGTLSHDLNRWWRTAILRQEDPYLKIGETNDRTTKGSSDYVWALRDINMEIKKGDVVGIIGKNGAGKSTLLKLLSRVTTPTTGTIKAHGRIGSLLEVGTGFHPEMTGRENIYMNGAILGMSKQEITRKFDEIVDFSGCERYIDTPVKRYSSGMMVRLGFAVAAHLDPEILIVDEVLAVGDAEFQKKAIGKMQDVSKGEGRTVLFVSHNMASVKSLCQSGVVMHNGSIVYSGNIKDSVDYYVGSTYSNSSNFYFENSVDFIGNDKIKLKALEFLPMEGHVITETSGIKIYLEFYNYNSDIQLDFSYNISTIDDIIIFSDGVDIANNDTIREGLYSCCLIVPNNSLRKGKYKFEFWFGKNHKYLLLREKDFVFSVEDAFEDSSPALIKTKLQFNCVFLK